MNLIGTIAIYFLALGYYFSAIGKYTDRNRLLMTGSWFALIGVFGLVIWGVGKFFFSSESSTITNHGIVFDVMTYTFPMNHMIVLFGFCLVFGGFMTKTCLNSFIADLLDDFKFIGRKSLSVLLSLSIIVFWGSYLYRTVSLSNDINQAQQNNQIKIITGKIEHKDKKNSINNVDFILALLNTAQQDKLIPLLSKIETGTKMEVKYFKHPKFKINIIVKIKIL
jgi:hypothetical protein